MAPIELYSGLGSEPTDAYVSLSDGSTIHFAGLLPDGQYLLQVDHM